MQVFLRSVAAAALATVVATWPTEPAHERRSRETVQMGAPVGDTRVRATLSDAAGPASAPIMGESTSLRSRVERLWRPETPRGRYQAFALLAECAHAVDFDRYLKALPADPETTRLRDRYGDGSARIAAACGDLPARHVDLRVELAASAADEGVPGAATAWVEEGPYGDKTALTQRPDDPLVIEWVQQAIARVHAATRRSDTEAIGQFGMLCLNWEMDDVARVRLLVEAGVERRREDQIRRVVN